MSTTPPDPPKQWLATGLNYEEMIALYTGLLSAALKGQSHPV